MNRETGPFAALWANVIQMGAEARDIQYASSGPGDFDLDSELAGGIDLPNLDDVDNSGGLLSFKGRQVLLYIPDQGRGILEVLADPSQGRKFHVADCETLKEMKAKGRFSRYTVTNSVSGVFAVSGVVDGRLVEGEAALKVCKNCLKYLNYREYRTGSRVQLAVFRGFSLAEFFVSYSTFFRHLPREGLVRDGVYTDDWPEVSTAIRVASKWHCQHCRVDLSDFRRLLHVHHIDGNKQNNEARNLTALCADCHRKEPFHEHMSIRKDDMEAIQRARRLQGILGASSGWDELFRYVDESYKGVLKLLADQGRSLPEVGYDIDVPGKGVVMTVEIAWPEERRAIVADEEALGMLAGTGWRGTTVSDVLAA